VRPASRLLSSSRYLAANSSEACTCATLAASRRTEIDPTDFNRTWQCEAGMEVEGINAFCRVGKAPASGKTWSSIGSGRPAQGQELTSQDELASALATKTEFTQAEVDVLLKNISLDTESFVRSGNSYYVPTEALAFGPKGEFCDTRCKACPASKHSAQAGSLECEICQLNTFAAEPKTIHCSLCQIGQSTAGKTAATSCTPCASGTFNDEPGQDCRPCPGRGTPKEHGSRVTRVEV